MRELLDSLHEFLGNCQSVADYLGYTLRGYMKIRRKVFNGHPLPPRVEALLRFKAEQLASESLNKDHEEPDVGAYDGCQPGNGRQDGHSLQRFDG